jgi:hypothetical protein
VLGSSPLHVRTIAQSADFGTNAANAARFYTTAASYANDLSGTGQKRINLNALVTEGLTASDIAGDMQDIIYAITGNQVTSMGNGTSRLLGGLPNANSPFPNFGSRFYSGANATSKNIYLKKIAANIRDYIDADSQPTLVNTSGNVEGPVVPAEWYNNWPPQAIGKEAIPYLQETAWAGNEVSWSGAGSTRTATIEIDHYLEFFNPSTKSFVAPPGTKIQFSNGPSWDAGIYPALEIDDFELDISGVSFPAGRVTVITTNPGPAANDPPGLILDPTTIVRITPSPSSARIFVNRMTNESINGQPGFQNQLLARDSAVADNQSRLIVAGMNGIYGATPVYGYTGAGSFYWNFKGANIGDRKRFVYSSSLMGNSADGRSGDPRSLNEQLKVLSYNSANQDNTRFYGNIQGNSVIPGAATLGKAALPPFVDTTKNQGTLGAWGDYTPVFNDTSTTAFNIIRDEPMVSIGELGHIYDPYRLASPSGIEYSRGGGRTLKIGQPDDVIGSAARFSATWQNAAWRLTDVFGVSSNRTQVELEPTSRGKININSVGRDGGMALKSLLRNYVFPASPASDAGTAGKILREDNDEINYIVSSVSSYLTSNGPFMERGELSQISFFSGYPNPRTIGSQKVRESADRSREQIFRGLAEMITTRSASFAVYSVGEALQESDTGAIKALGRSYMGSVYTITPNLPSALRSTPTDFTVKKLYDIP